MSRSDHLPRSVAWWVVACAALAASAGCGKGAPKEPILVFAAASLTESLNEVGQKWAATGHPVPNFTYDASSRLARQIESGAPADLFFSADTSWMNDLSRKSLLDEWSRIDLVGNELVVIVPVRSDGGDAPAPASLADLARPEFAHLAVAGESVPAGHYARRALEEAGLLATLEPRMISADNVRAALTWVAGGDADAGIVYATDARVEPRVRVAMTIPPEAAAPIIYPAALVKGAPSSGEARSFLSFCRGDHARRIFIASGFRPLAGPP